jgi:hypothetical protein
VYPAGIPPVSIPASYMVASWIVQYITGDYEATSADLLTTEIAAFLDDGKQHIYSYIFSV